MRAHLVLIAIVIATAAVPTVVRPAEPVAEAVAAESDAPRSRLVEGHEAATADWRGAMRSLEIGELDAWLQDATPGGHHLYEVCPAGTERRVVWRDAREQAHALFVRVLARMVLLLGITPCFPAPTGSDWRGLLGVAGGLCAVWNYDYYQLSVCVLDRGVDDCIVIVNRHVAE